VTARSLDRRPRVPIGGRRVAWNDGAKMADSPDRQVWDKVLAKRRYEWKPLDDAVYTTRYHTLCFHYHPAVAAVMAHDVAAGPGCIDRRIRRR
jgi:hypothetical protein